MGSRRSASWQPLDGANMSVLRFDPTTLDWVVFAPSRARRPHELRQRPSEDGADGNDAEHCPFCCGNEDRTPPEIDADRPYGGTLSQWRVRVVANKSPALRIEEDNHRHENGEGFRYLGGCGAHEVIIESPDHSRLLADQPVEQIERVLRIAQSRHQDLMRDSRFQTVVIFKNHGEAAGTSLKHPHWQLIATPVVPRMLRLKHMVATDYFDQTGECLYCAVLKRELASQKRVLAVNSAFVAFLPYASHLPFETWILPRQHQACFGAVRREQLLPLADLLRTVLVKLHRGLENPDFNLTIDTVSRGDESKEYFLWHIRILPRLTTTAGFELGSGMSINTVLPEEAAEYLRGVEVSLT